MRLATLKAGGRDGTLVVVSRDFKMCSPVAAKFGGSMGGSHGDGRRRVPLTRKHRINFYAGQTLYIEIVAR